MAGTTNAFEMAQAQFDHVAELLKLDSQVREILRWPMREYHFRIPVRMDDGSIRVFQGFRVQHNDARGPNKGGIRFHPAETIDTVRAYATRFPGVELFYLIGGDQPAHLPLWREAKELARLAQFLIIPRPGEAAAPLAAPFRGRVLRGFPLEISSSEIRRRIQGKLPWAHLVPATVAEAIRNNGLYL